MQGSLGQLLVFSYPSGMIIQHQLPKGLGLALNLEFMQGAVPDPNSGILPVKSFVAPVTESFASPHDCCSVLLCRDVV